LTYAFALYMLTEFYIVSYFPNTQIISRNYGIFYDVILKNTE
jgi:hypothetical protein